MIFNNHLVISSCFLLVSFVNYSSQKPYLVTVWQGSLTKSTFVFGDENQPANQSIPDQKYIPRTQNCMKTGLTMCNEVQEYPSDIVLNLIQTTFAKNFNFSSIFSDESHYDLEPNLETIRETEGNLTNDYILYQTQLRYYYLTLQDLPSYYDINNYGLNPIFVLPQQTSATTPLPGNKSYTFHWNPFTDPPVVQEKLMAKPIFFTRFKTTPKPSISYAQRPVYNSTRSNRHFRKIRSKREQTEVEEVCKIRSTYITPRIGLNDKSEWKYIVNLAERDPHIKQVIKVDICAQPDSPCSNQISLPFGYVSKCKQKYIKKKLLSLDINGLGTSTENFFVPSCCVCEIVRSDSDKRR